MARKRLSEEVVARWVAFFRPPVEPTTSPELPRREPFPTAPPPVEKSVLAPEPSPGGKIPRMVFVRDGQLWEKLPDGRVFLATDDGHPREDIGVAERRRMNAQINFE